MKSMTLIILQLWLFNVYAQDSTKAYVNWGSDNQEMNELYSLLKIDPYHFKFTDKKLENKKFRFSYTEYKEGKMSYENLFYKEGSETEKRATYRPTDSAFNFKVYAHKLNKDSVEIFFRFQRFGQAYIFKTLPTNDYSLRDATSSLGKRFSSIPVGKKIPFLVYALPYEDKKYPGQKFYCALTGDGVPPEKWGEVYGVKHYVVFYLEII
jgi:hypothetical protein